MSKSSLVNVVVPAYSGNYTIGRSGRKIEAITIHHMAGVLSAEQCGNIFKQVGRGGSSHYGIGNDGRIGLYVDEENTAWTNSNWDSNCKSVTIETSNCEIGNNWKVSDAALNSLIRLVADIGKRNNLGTLVKGKNVTWHSMYTATACPGEYLLSKMDYIIAEANKLNNPEPSTDKPSTGNTYIVQEGDYLISIGKKLGVDWQEIAQINDLSEPYTIYPNQVLIIPTSGSNEIKTGDKVKVLNNTQYNGEPFVTYYKVYDVIEVNGDRVVIGINNVVTCAINIKNIEKVN